MIVAARGAGDLAEHGGDRHSASSSDTQSLKDLGISYELAAYCDRLASLPDEVWETWHAPATKKCRPSNSPRVGPIGLSRTGVWGLVLFDFGPVPEGLAFGSALRVQLSGRGVSPRSSPVLLRAGETASEARLPRRRDRGQWVWRQCTGRPVLLWPPVHRWRSSSIHAADQYTRGFTATRGSA
jgi:hypothetical protein